MKHNKLAQEVILAIEQAIIQADRALHKIELIKSAFPRELKLVKKIVKGGSSLYLHNRAQQFMDSLSDLRDMPETEIQETKEVAEFPVSETKFPEIDDIMPEDLPPANGEATEIGVHDVR